MNRFAFRLSSYTLKTFSGFSKARINIQGQKNIPDGAVIFCANHFTRIETVFLPYHIHNMTGKQVWSLAARGLFQVPVLKGLLDRLGALSIRDPKRDEVILKTLLSGKVHWIIFPEGMMVKNKKLVKEPEFSLISDKGKLRPHTGAAVAALQCAFFTERLNRLKSMNAPEFERLAAKLDIRDIDLTLNQSTHIVPVNITYYPANPRENILGTMARLLLKEPSKRVMDELLTEGAMLFSGADITIRFGESIDMKPYLSDPYIESMLMVKRPVRFTRDVSSKQITRQISHTIMQRYMKAVYQLTTLNYDHVMACILKHLPYRRNGVAPYEFRCKVYYAITCLMLNRLCRVSDHFFNNQIHLLINDRHKRVATFLDLAEKTGVIRWEKDRFFTDHARFAELPEFHAARMENPLLVMANEVETVDEAEICMKKIAQKSGGQIMSMIGRRIIEKMQVDFTADYATYYQEGESKKKRIGRPLFFRQDHPTAGVLLIHGYMAAPEEMKQFGRYLHGKGFTVHLPRLKGHGTAPEDLARTSYESWMESVEEAWVTLRHSCDTLFVGGFSTGAGLALELATRVSDVKAVFAVAPPMRLNDLGSYFVPAIDTWNGMIKRINLTAMAKEFIANEPENPHINYVRNPIAGVHQLEKLMEQLEPKLKTIHKPVLVVQSRKDPVVSPRGTEKLFKSLGSEIKEYFLFDDPRHGILTGKGRERVFQAIENFISQWLR